MPHAMSPKKEQEFEELRAYLDFYFTQFLGFSPSDPAHPSNVMADVIKKYGKSKALEGLKQAVNDTVVMLDSKPLDYVQAVDRALQEKGLTTLSEVRRRYSSSYKSVLKRGRINNETEYYLLAGILTDASSTVSDDDRELIEKIAAQYEKTI